MSLPQSRRGTERHRLGAGDEPLDEPVVDLVGDEHPLHRDAELAGVGERRPDGALGGLLEVGVAQHQDRVLAAELERAADQPLGALLGDELAGGGRAGEADVVGALDDRRCRPASRGRRRPATGPSGSRPRSSSSAAEQRGEHGLGVRLGDDGVAGQQRGQAVAERHRERVVPRRDDADDALRDAVDLDPGQARDDAELALGVEVLVRPCARSSGRSARCAAARRTRACGPCRTPTRSGR